MCQESLKKDSVGKVLQLLSWADNCSCSLKTEGRLILASLRFVGSNYYFQRRRYTESPVVGKGVSVDFIFIIILKRNPLAWEMKGEKETCRETIFGFFFPSFHFSLVNEFSFWVCKSDTFMMTELTIAWPIVKQNEKKVPKRLTNGTVRMNCLELYLLALNFLIRLRRKMRF